MYAMKSITDLQIIDSVLKGNTNDYAMLITRYKHKGFTLLNRLLRNREDAEEVLQDAFLKAFNALPYFRKDSKFSTWFYRIVYNAGISFIAKNKKMITWDNESIENVEIADFESLPGFSKPETGNVALYKVLDMLPVRNSVILILFYVDGLSVPEIAGVTGLTEQNVKVILHRSRHILKKMIMGNKLLKEVFYE